MPNGFIMPLPPTELDHAAAVMDWYRLRGEYSENRIKELKPGFGMERMPCGQFAANVTRHA